jgi:flagellar biosynthesis protein FliQ
VANVTFVPRLLIVDYPLCLFNVYLIQSVQCVVANVTFVPRLLIVDYLCVLSNVYLLQCVQ